MTNTPETDAAVEASGGDWSPVLRAVSQRLERERDELIAALPVGEWVSYADYQKVHNAASRLLVAINKQLPIGCFTLVSSEYYRLQNAIYGREGAK